MIQRFRVPLGFVVAAAVLYLATPTRLSLAVGFPVAVIGALCRALAAGIIRKDARLATSGIYTWTRNPLYFGSFLLSVGFAIMSWSVLAAALLIVPSAVVYPNVIRNEESHLRHLFGAEFEAYCRSVPRFLPRIGRLEQGFSLAQYTANREYNAAIGLIAGTLVLAWKL